MTPEEVKERGSAWLNPISADAPQGIDARYEEAHELIRQQVAAMDRPDGGEVDWPQVVTEATQLLTQTSKDITIGAHAAYGMYRSQGLDGLATGIACLAEMMDAFWDDMFPSARRERARANAVGWLVDKLTLNLGSTQVTGADYTAVYALQAASKRLREVSSSRFNAPPGLRPLLDDIERLRLSLPADAAAQAPAAAAAPAVNAPAAQEPAQGAPQPTASGASAEPAAAPAAASAEGASGPVPAEELAGRAKPYLEPIDGGAGQDCRYEESHVAMRALVSQMDNPAAEAIDWSGAVVTGETILKSQSKDLLIASYLCYALYQTRGLDGLATGLAMLTGVIEVFWDGAFPPLKRIRARKNSLTWLVEQLETPLSEMIPAASERQSIELLEVAVAKFQSVVYEKFGDSAPAVRPLKDAVARAKLSLPADKPAPKPEPKAPVAPVATTPAPSTASAPASVSLGDAPAAGMADPAEVGKFLLGIGKALTGAAGKLRSAAAADPVSYRIVRLGLYLHMPHAPPTQQGNKTGIPAPPATLATQFDTLLSNQSWPALLEEAESALRQHRFWVDIHRYVAVALGGMGTEYEDAQAAVIDGVRSLLARMPELLEYQFVDGTPLCGEATHSWLSAEVMTGGGGAGGGGAGGGEEDDVIVKVRGLAAGGKAAEAIGLVEKSLSAVSSDRARFRLRLAMAQACSAAGNAFMARGVFAGLVSESEQRALDDWEPSLSAELYEAYIKCLNTLKKTDAIAATEAAAIYQRLCRVDLAAALRVSD